MSGTIGKTTGISYENRDESTCSQSDEALRHAADDLPPSARKHYTLNSDPELISSLEHQNYVGVGLPKNIASEPL